MVFCCFLMSLASFCSHLSCILVSSSGAEIDLFRHVPTIGLIFNLSRAIHAGQSDSVKNLIAITYLSSHA